MLAKENRPLAAPNLESRIFSYCPSSRVRGNIQLTFRSGIVLVIGLLGLLALVRARRRIRAVLAPRLGQVAALHVFICDVVAVASASYCHRHCSFRPGWRSLCCCGCCRWCFSCGAVVVVCCCFCCLLVLRRARRTGVGKGIIGEMLVASWPARGQKDGGGECPGESLLILLLRCSCRRHGVISNHLS